MAVRATEGLETLCTALEHLSVDRVPESWVAALWDAQFCDVAGESISNTKTLPSNSRLPKGSLHGRCRSRCATKAKTSK
jgi:hypothetical protein